MALVAGGLTEEIAERLTEPAQTPDPRQPGHDQAGQGTVPSSLSWPTKRAWCAPAGWPDCLLA